MSSVAPPEPDTLPRAQQARRARIVEAALALLETGEYEAIQMRDVAERAGVALATIYRYFSSKEHLYAAVVLHWAATYSTGGGRAGTGDDEARFRRLMRRAVRAFERHPQVMRVLIVLESSADPNARALFDRFAERNTDTLMDALASLDPATAGAVIEVANCVMVTRLRSWALGRCTIGGVDRSVQRALDLVFAAPPAARD